ncbi:MAG: hypothetical protein R3Y21_05570 [Mycoplasmatota bacterium]
MSMPIIVPSTVTRDEAITDIIASVALQQTGLSHIINAEGEKIQAAIKYASNAHELLEVNESVNQMISSITKLEVILQSKLELFKNCLCVKSEEVKISFSINDLGGTITNNGNNTYIYTPGEVDGVITMTLEPTQTLTLISTLPEGVKYENNVLYISPKVEPGTEIKFVDEFGNVITITTK